MRFEFRHRRCDGSIRDVEVFCNQVEIAGKALLYSIIHDITNRKRAEAQKAELEAQNRQLQKAESLGRMAGAIAHHFNNQLQVVMGNLEMAMMDDLPRGSQTLTEALKAARKAAEVSSLIWKANILNVPTHSWVSLISLRFLETRSAAHWYI